MHENRAVWRSKNLPWLWPILLFLLGALWVWGLVKPAGATPAADPGPQWVLVWSDEFNGTSIDTTKWNVSNGHSGINNELAYYTPNNVSVSGGNLILVSKNNDFISGATEGYTSGQVNTAGKYEFQYGRVEVRAKLPDGQGIWPAHWTLEGRCSASQVIGGCHFWPPEIDILERINTEAQVHQTWHPENGAGSGFTVSGTTFATSFHTYEVEWDPGEIRFYVDGVRTGLAQSNITSRTALLILQTAIGGSWPGNPDGTTVFPQYHYIDYVRHLKLCGTCTPQPTATPTQTATPTLTPTVVPSGGSARIESGGTSSYTDSGGNLWVPDSGCSGGGGIVDRGAIAIANTVDDRIYQTERWGLTGCSFNVASGSYTVRLHFAETHVGITGAGQRVFSVNVEGQALNNLDVFAETGGRNIALIKTFVVNVTDGKLTLTFTPNVEQPLINGIEILPPGPTPTPGPSPTPTTTPTPTQTTPNTHGGTWAGKGILDGRSTWKALKQTVSGVATNTSYVGSVWIKGTGPAVDLRVQTGAGTILSAKRCDSIGVWVQCTTPTLNTGSNTSLVLLVVDYYGGDPDGVVYVDDAFLGISGGANKVANPGFESGAVNWTAQVPWSIVNNP